MVTLEMHDGTVYDVRYMGKDHGFLWIEMIDKDIPECCGIFDDKGKTETMVYRYGEQQEEYEGFTQIHQMMMDEDAGICSVCMIKEAEQDA